jgi:hypothetical protein
VKEKEWLGAHLRAARYGGQPSRGLPTVAHAHVGKRERRLEAPPGLKRGAGFEEPPREHLIGCRRAVKRTAPGLRHFPSYAIEELLIEDKRLGIEGVQPQVDRALRRSVLFSIPHWVQLDFAGRCDMLSNQSEERLDAPEIRLSIGVGAEHPLEVFDGALGDHRREPTAATRVSADETDGWERGILNFWITALTCLLCCPAPGISCTDRPLRLPHERR